MILTTTHIQVTLPERGLAFWAVCEMRVLLLYFPKDLRGIVMDTREGPMMLRIAHITVTALEPQYGFGANTIPTFEIQVLFRFRVKGFRGLYADLLQAM